MTASAAATPKSLAAEQELDCCRKPNLVRTKTKIPHNINDYLYVNAGDKSKSSNSNATNNNNYHKYASPEPLPQTDIYVAIQSWAPKCLHSATSYTTIKQEANVVVPAPSPQLSNWREEGGGGRLRNILEPAQSEYE